MGISDIDIKSLRLNPHNDRHGPLRDEPSAVQWLLENKPAHMKALATDIAETKRLFEYPLVQENGSDFIVFDGNRRICCVKLLHFPRLSPSEKWVDFFAELSSEELRRGLSSVPCEVEDGLDTIDQKLLRRHTGTQEGVGQSPWDANAKSNFMQRTGKDSGGLGESLERVLQEEGRIGENETLPWSNAERLLSSEPIRKRVGISFSRGELIFLAKKDRVLDNLEQIARDLANKQIVLGDIWNNEKKRKYLDTLKSKGFAVDIDLSAQPIRPKSREQTETVTRRRKRAPKQKNLISSVDTNPFIDLPQMERAENIWRELQFTLEFDDHGNAIAVLMRVLLELCVEHYLRRNSIPISSKERLSRRVSLVANSMQERGLIDYQARSIITKFEQGKPIVSAHSMHQYVHNPNFHPTKNDLKAIWTVVRVIIMNSVK